MTGARGTRRKLKDEGLILPTKGVPAVEWDTQQTWDEVEAEGAAIVGAWMEDTAVEVFALGERIVVGWQRFYEAKRIGDDAAAERIYTKIGQLQAQAWSLDALSRRLLCIRGLLTLRSLLGADITVSIDSPQYRQRVRP